MTAAKANLEIGIGTPLRTELIVGAMPARFRIACMFDRPRADCRAGGSGVLRLLGYRAPYDFAFLTRDPRQALGNCEFTVSECRALRPGPPRGFGRLRNGFAGGQARAARGNPRLSVALDERPGGGHSFAHETYAPPSGDTSYVSTSQADPGRPNGPAPEPPQAGQSMPWSGMVSHDDGSREGSSAR
jgi:hypothetical protein